MRVIQALWHIEKWLEIMKHCIVVSTFAFYSLFTFITNKNDNKILIVCVDVLKLSDWVIRDIGFSSSLVSVKMNLDSGKTNPCINRLLLNPKGIFVILRGHVIPTILPGDVTSTNFDHVMQLRMTRFLAMIPTTIKHRLYRIMNQNLLRRWRLQTTPC